jgi:hypothetical protein
VLYSKNKEFRSQRWSTNCSEVYLRFPEPCSKNVRAKVWSEKAASNICTLKNVTGELIIIMSRIKHECQDIKRKKKKIGKSSCVLLFLQLFELVDRINPQVIHIECRFFKGIFMR